MYVYTWIMQFLKQHLKESEPYTVHTCMYMHPSVKWMPALVFMQYITSHTQTITVEQLSILDIFAIDESVMIFGGAQKGAWDRKMCPVYHCLYIRVY